MTLKMIDKNCLPLYRLWNGLFQLFKIYIFALLLLGFGAAGADAQEAWNQFRGPRGNGVAPKGTVLTDTLDLETQVVWKTAVPGIGWSSPVIDSNRIWITSAVTELASPEEIQQKLERVQVPEIKTVAKSLQLYAICLDVELGVILHNRLLASIENPEIINPLNSYASPTPAIAQGNVVCHFGSYGTWCLDAQTGAEIWHRQYVVDHSVGPGSSPVIFEDKVLLVCDGMDQQFVVCLDLETGEEVWRTARPPVRTSNPEFKKSFSTPLIIEAAGKTQAVIPAAEWIASYDPRTGREIWRANHGDGYSIAPMPTYQSGMIVFSTGYGRPDFVGVDPTGEGDVTATHIRWRAKNAPAMPSFVGHEGKVYTVTESGILTCLDAESGDIIAKSRLGGNYSASPILANRRLYFFSREGFASIFDCSPEFQQLARTNFANPIMASPAMIENDLIIRTRDFIYRIKASH
jgi:outer membrane protein assembly factor BamB